MHLSLYGGSFNPPHVAHQLAVAYVLATTATDEVWVTPAPSHAFGKPLASFEHRMEMTRLAMRHFGARVVVSALEAQLPQPSRTLHTLEALAQQVAGAQLSLVVGADILPETGSWLGWDQIQVMAKVVVLGRQGFAPTGTLALPEVSSTDVRQRLAAGQPVDHLVDMEVLAFIHREGLYGAAVRGGA